ncbi:putative MFS family arabinose efflux permease [Kitasatospora sp. MAP12-15]|uniref:MFS transporter n=1 Tax=unclassified Kitasatospora TaxID=2633591 RepID=UPI0024743727|nr:MFS transporter [Kitasatospora sp. MAP12-44]MDH6110433.1 putative MFS family arabinose efflux permease [Kitasatospora sp. MAP12-44]
MTADRRSLLHRNRDFRLLWTGEVAGKFGSSVTGLALPLIAATTLHAGAFRVSLLTMASWLPWLLIGLPVGAWVDRMRRRTVMMAASAGSLLLFLTVPVAAALGRLSFAQLLVVALLAGACAVFFQTAYTAYLPGLVAEPDRAEGNAKLQGSASAAQIVGLGTGGSIAQAFGAVDSLLANTVTFLVSLLCTARISHREPLADPAQRRGRTLLKEVGEGLSWVARDRWLRSFVLYGASSNLALTAYQSILVVFLIQQAGLPQSAIGAVIGLASVGGVVGALLARRVGAAIGTARATLFFLLGLPVLVLLIPLTTGGAGVLCYLVGGFAVSAGVVAGNVLRSTFQQRYCPAELLGRVTAGSAFLNYGTIPLGALAGGSLAALLGLRAAMWVATAAVPLAAGILWFSPLRGLRDLPTGLTLTLTPAVADRTACATAR